MLDEVRSADDGVVVETRQPLQLSGGIALGTARGAAGIVPWWCVVAHAVLTDQPAGM